MGDVIISRQESKQGEQSSGKQCHQQANVRLLRDVVVSRAPLHALTLEEAASAQRAAKLRSNNEPEALEESFMIKELITAGVIPAGFINDRLERYLECLG